MDHNKRIVSDLRRRLLADRDQFWKRSACQGTTPKFVSRHPTTPGSRSKKKLDAAPQTIIIVILVAPRRMLDHGDLIPAATEIPLTFGGTVPHDPQFGGHGSSPLAERAKDIRPCKDVPKPLHENEIIRPRWRQPTRSDGRVPLCLARRLIRSLPVHAEVGETEAMTDVGSITTNELGQVRSSSTTSFPRRSSAASGSEPDDDRRRLGRRG